MITNGTLEFVNEDSNTWYVSMRCAYDDDGQWINGTYTAQLIIGEKTINITGVEKGTSDHPAWKVSSSNYFKQIGMDNKQLLTTPDGGIRLFMSKQPGGIVLISDVSYQGGNTFEFLNGTDYYTVTPRLESCTTLFTKYNIQTSGIVIGENIESHVFALNSLGNTVDIAVNNISELNDFCVQLQQEIEALQPKTDWFNIILDVVDISTMAFTFGGGLFRVCKEGITACKALSFEKDVEMELEDVEEIIHDIDVLAPRELTKEAEFVESTSVNELLVTKYYYPTMKDGYKIDVSFKVDTEDEVLNIILFTYSSKNGCTTTDSTTNCEVKYNSPWILVYDTKQPENVNVRYTPKLNQTPIGLGESLTNKQLMTASAIKKLIENHQQIIKNELPNIKDYRKINDISFTTYKELSTLGFPVNVIDSDWYNTIQFDLPEGVTQIHIIGKARISENYGQTIIGEYSVETILDLSKANSYGNMTIDITDADSYLNINIPNVESGYEHCKIEVYHGSLPQILTLDTIRCNATDELVLKSELDELANTIPDNIVNTTTLATTLSDYAKKTDVPDMSLYRTANDLTYTTGTNLTIGTNNNTSTITQNTVGAHLVGTVTLKDNNGNPVVTPFDIIFEPNVPDQMNVLNNYMMYISLIVKIYKVIINKKRFINRRKSFIESSLTRLNKRL